MSLCDPPKFPRKLPNQPRPKGTREPYHMTEVTSRVYWKRGKYGERHERVPLLVWVRFPETWKEVTGVRWTEKKGRKTKSAVLEIQGGSLLELTRDIGTECFAVRAADIGQGVLDGSDQE